MKILLLTTHLNTGGVGIYTVNLAKYLKENGVEVSIASSGGNLIRRLQEIEVEHIDIDIKTKSEFSVKIWKTLPILNKIVLEGGFDLVHAQTRVAQVLCYLSEKATGVPFVSTCHGFFKHKRLSRRILPCWGKRTIAISKSVEKHLLEDFHLDPLRVKQVYNGIELYRYVDADERKRYNLRQAMHMADDLIIIGSVGRLSSVKGFGYLIKAFEKATLVNAKIRLLIIGEGPEEERLKKMASALGIRNKVLFISGNVPLENYLTIMDVFCLLSIKEGLGLSVMEAMAAGRACVASEVGGLAELIDDKKDGILVPSKDADSAKDAILLIACDRDLRNSLGAKAREKAKNNFSIIESVKKTIEVYEEVIGDNAFKN